MNVKVRLVAEMAVFDTLQGEGVLSGMPSLFVRLAGCDLRCNRDVLGGTGWSCDTPHSLPDYDPKARRFRTLTKFAQEIEASELADRVACYESAHIVVTGGEPTLQAGSLVVFLALLEERYRRQGLLGGRMPHVTLETNGRHFSAALANRINLVSLSPKVYQPDSIDMAKLIQWCTNTSDVQVKIVMADLIPAAEALGVFEVVRTHCPRADLFVQRADVPNNERKAEEVVHWVINNEHARALGVRYGAQMHKVIGVP